MLECGKLYYTARCYCVESRYAGLPAYLLACGPYEYVLFGTYQKAPGTFGPGYGYLYYGTPGHAERREPKELFAAGIFDCRRRRW